MAVSGLFVVNSVVIIHAISFGVLIACSVVR